MKRIPCRVYVNAEKRFLETTGYHAEFPGFEEFTFAVTRALTHDDESKAIFSNKGWTVTEIETGFKIGYWGNTRQAAINQAARILSTKTPQDIREAIEKGKAIVRSESNP